MLSDQQQKKYHTLINPSSINKEALAYLSTAWQAGTVRTVFEFGSGVSTLLWSDLFPEARIFSIDHEQIYFHHTRRLLNGALSRVSLMHSPLTLMKYHHRYFVSYKTQNFEKHLPKDIIFDLVFIDGPPGFLYGREATLYQILPHIDARTILLLDDAQRPYEQQALSYWQSIYDFSFLEMLTMGDKTLARFALKNPKQTPKSPMRPAASVHRLGHCLKLLAHYRAAAWRERLKSVLK